RTADRGHALEPLGRLPHRFHQRVLLRGGFALLRGADDVVIVTLRAGGRRRRGNQDQRERPVCERLYQSSDVHESPPYQKHIAPPEDEQVRRRQPVAPSTWGVEVGNLSG